MEEDPDLLAEASLEIEKLQIEKPVITESARNRAYRWIPLELNRDNSYVKSNLTAELLDEIGGSKALCLVEETFYDKMFADAHLDSFVRSHDDPHHVRLSNWIAEKMGGEGNNWSEERKKRNKNPTEITLPHVGTHVVHDRSSAHVAAWFSPKRAGNVVGEHFKLHDARVWMRLQFWAMREHGIFEKSPTFCCWFVRFIGHFMRVYERLAIPFARESSRWSQKEENIKIYRDAGNRMVDVLGADGFGVEYKLAQQALPREEYRDQRWPYGSHQPPSEIRSLLNS